MFWARGLIEGHAGTVSAWGCRVRANRVRPGPQGRVCTVGRLCPGIAARTEPV